MNNTRLTILAALVAFPLMACSPSGDKGSRSAATSSQDAGATADAKASQPAPAANTTAATDTVGQVDESQMKTLLDAVAAKAARGTASLVDANASTPAAAATALETAFKAKLAANPGVLTQAQADDLISQLNTFVSTSSSMDAKSSAAAWNAINANLKKIKAARPSSSSLALTDPFSKGTYSTGGLLTSVLGVLGGYNYVTAAPVTTTTTSPSSTVVVGSTDVMPASTATVASCNCTTGSGGGLVGGVLGVAVYAVEDVLGLALSLVGAVLGVADAVVYTAADLVDAVFGILI